MATFPLQTVGRGMIQSVPRYVIPDGGYFSSDGLSMYKGALTVAPGYVKFNAGQVLNGLGVMALDYFRDSLGASHLVAMTTTKGYRYEAGTFVDITRQSGGLDVNYTGGLSDIWLSDICPNVAGPDTLWYVTTNGLDPVQKWDGSNAGILNPLLGAAVDAGQHFSKALAMFQGSLFHLNRKESGKFLTRKLVWSDTGNIESYYSTLTVHGIAGDLVLFQGFDEGLRLEPLANYLVAYREGSIHIISFTGSPFFFSQQQVVSGVGMIAPRALLNLDKRHVFLGNDDVYLFNGADLKSVGEEIRDQLFSELDRSVAFRSIIGYDAVRMQMLLVVPGPNNNGYPNTWWLWNINTGVWSGPVRNRPITGLGDYLGGSNISWDSFVGTTWQQMTGSWDSLVNATQLPSTLFGTGAGIVYQIDNKTSKADGVVVTGRFESRAVYPGGTLQPPAQDVIVTEWLPLTTMAGASLVDWFLGVSDNPMGPFAYTGPVRVGPRGLVKFKPTRGKWFVVAGQASDSGSISGGVLGFERGWTDTSSG